MKNWLLAGLLLASMNLWAGVIMPASCQPLLVAGEMIELKVKKPVVVLLYNDSTSTVWITHPVDNPSLSAGWSSQLERNHWSALALSDKSFKIACIESKPGHEQSVPCSGLLSVCLWSSVGFPDNASGTFWIAENEDKLTLQTSILKRGFKLPKKSQSMVN